ncbi:hypothetical protein GQX74_015456 [Glossina fuscipes]|nr:hypothetical protein GQX74_015456 [Glossina fuscipes]
MLANQLEDVFFATNAILSKLQYFGSEEKRNVGVNNGGLGHRNVPAIPVKCPAANHSALGLRRIVRKTELNRGKHLSELDRLDSDTSVTITCPPPFRTFDYHHHPHHRHRHMHHKHETSGISISVKPLIMTSVCYHNIKTQRPIK